MKKAYALLVSAILLLSVGSGTVMALPWDRDDANDGGLFGWFDWFKWGNWFNGDDDNEQPEQDVYTTTTYTAADQSEKLYFIGWGVAEHYQKLGVTVVITYDMTWTQKIKNDNSEMIQTVDKEGTATIQSLIGTVIDTQPFSMHETLTDVGIDAGADQLVDGDPLYMIDHENQTAVDTLEAYDLTWAIGTVYEYTHTVEDGVVVADEYVVEGGSDVRKIISYFIGVVENRDAGDSVRDMISLRDIIALLDIMGVTPQDFTDMIGGGFSLADNPDDIRALLDLMGLDLWDVINLLR